MNILKTLNPFEQIWCANTDADEADYRFVPRWCLWRADLKRALGLRLSFADCYKPVRGQLQ